jgi:biotin synthase
MFDELGLNVRRQPDNAANPRPDNRSGWLSGETPDVVGELLHAGASRRGQVVERGALAIRLWNPATQLRHRAKRKPPPPRPDGAPNAAPTRAAAAG